MKTDLVILNVKLENMVVVENQKREYVGQKLYTNEEIDI